MVSEERVSWIKHVFSFHTQYYSEIPVLLIELCFSFPSHF